MRQPNSAKGRREIQAKKREQSRRQTLARHGITQSDYDQMLELQDGKCALCRQPGGKTNFAFEHDHSHCATGCRECWRGLACKRCNLIILGWCLRESSMGKNHAIGILMGMIDYVKHGGFPGSPNRARLGS